MLLRCRAPPTHIREPFVMRCLGIDVGSKHVGLAISDESGTVARPYTTIARKECVSNILHLIEVENVSVVVLGESIDLDGSPNPVMEDVQEVAEALKGHVKVVFQPEQFSTQAAMRTGKRSQDRVQNNAKAAAVILERYLERPIG